MPHRPCLLPNYNNSFPPQSKSLLVPLRLLSKMTLTRSSNCVEWASAALRPSLLWKNTATMCKRHSTACLERINPYRWVIISLLCPCTFLTAGPSTHSTLSAGIFFQYFLSFYLSKFMLSILSSYSQTLHVEMNRAIIFSLVGIMGALFADLFSTASPGI